MQRNVFAVPVRCPGSTLAKRMSRWDDQQRRYAPDRISADRPGCFVAASCRRILSALCAFP